MQIEYEATYANVDKDKVRARLKKAGAELVRPEFMQKRVVFNLPKGHEIPGGWLRVRDEGDKITMSLKAVLNGKIETQKEIQLIVDSFENAENMLVLIGCEKKSYQETRREIWMMDDVEICIDEWPYLEPLVEIEGDSEEKVKNVSQKLQFDYTKALFCSAGHLYELKYGIPEDSINNDFSLITFDMENPFTK